MPDFIFMQMTRVNREKGYCDNKTFSRLESHLPSFASGSVTAAAIKDTFPDRIKKLDHQIEILKAHLFPFYCYRFSSLRSNYVVCNFAVMHMVLFHSGFTHCLMGIFIPNGSVIVVVTLHPSPFAHPQLCLS